MSTIEIIVSFISGIGASCIVIFFFKLLKPIVKISSVIIKQEDKCQIKVVNLFLFPLKNIRYNLYLVKINGSTSFKHHKLTGDFNPTVQSLIKLKTIDTFTKPQLHTVRRMKLFDTTYMNALELNFQLKSEDSSTQDLIFDFLNGNDNIYLEFEFYCESTFSDSTLIKYKKFILSDIKNNGKFAFGNSCKYYSDKK